MAFTKELSAQVFQFLDAHQQEMLALWAEFVNIRSDATEREKANEMACRLREELEAIGCECELYDVGEKNGFAVEGLLGRGRPGKPILFSGHYDVVPLKGEYPFYIDAENKAHGLGCLDMKGGIVIAIWVAKALAACGWAERPLKFVFVGDEENGHQWGESKEFLLAHTSGALCAFNLETGLESNAICIGRKGTGQATVTVHGVAAHSGNSYSEGRSAITEMTHQIAQIEALTDLAANTTVAVTTIQGGTVANSIPPVCSCIVDLRFGSAAEKQRVLDGLARITADTAVPDTSASFEFREFMAPFDSTPAVKALADFVEGVSVQYGFGEMGRVFLGGGSDAAFVLQAGTPCICSIGVQGAYNHSPKEYAQVESMFRRAKLLAAAVLHSGELKLA